MKNDINKIEEKIYTAGAVGSMLESIDSTMKILAENHSGVISRLDNIDNRFDLVETKIDRLQDDMVEVKFELKRKVDAEEFERLEKRVVKLENLSLSHQA